MIYTPPDSMGPPDKDAGNQVAADNQTDLSYFMTARGESTKDQPKPGPAPGERQQVKEEKFALSLKVSRQRRGSSLAPGISVWAQYRIWWSPFVAELCLFTAAVLLTVYLHQVIWSQGAEFPTTWYLGLGVSYLFLISHNRLNELYLPRPVVFFGLGTLVIISAVIVAIFIMDAWMIGGRNRAAYVLLAVVPMMAFLGRCFLLFKDARSTPPISALAMTANVKRNKFRDFRRRLRFWMS
jgi:hypothetical protein